MPALRHPLRALGRGLPGVSLGRQLPAGVLAQLPLFLPARIPAGELAAGPLPAPGGRRDRGETNMTLEERHLEELLEKLWTLREAGPPEESALDPREFPESWLAEAEARSLIRRREGRAELTDSGEAMAEGVVRRHRLAELLFSQVLEVPESDGEAQACEFEHVLSPAVTDRICAFLGHPVACPHGKPIPPGRCRRDFRRRG